MKNISIINIIGTSNAIIQAFGINVYNEILPYATRNEDVILDFTGISNVTSGFCNASIGKLYADFPSYSPSKIKLMGLSGNEIAIEKVQSAIDLATKPELSKLNNEIISDLFN
ncbi:STAS-like domain-containing protein [Flavobacterium sp.]|uniref:STAS-like domain-containing protein n=1 Tax=Flavobacterium sp. TaxID=239 RepID=UPI003F69C2AB